MNLKNAIRFVEYSSVFALCAFLLMTLSVIGAEGATVSVNFWILSLSLLLLLVYLFKSQIIQYHLAHSKYKKLFYYIIHKIHLAEKISLGMAVQDMPGCNMYNLSEADFLQDNKLVTKVGRRRVGEWKLLLNIALFIGIILLVCQLLSISIDDAAMGVVVGCMGIAFGYLFSNSAREVVGEPLMVFDERVLTVQGKEIDWHNLLDWQYNRRDNTNNSSISIYYFDAYLEVKSENIELFQLNIRKIDLVLLLTLYKEKYGKNIY